MGVVTIDPHSHIKLKTKFYISPSLVKTDPIVSKIQPFKNVEIYKEMYGHLDTTSGCPYISLLFLTFLNSCISVKTSLISTKLGDFVNLRVLFVTMWINSCLYHNLQTRTKSFFGLKSGYTLK